MNNRRVDPNSISLRRYQKRRQQKFNKNSNIISKYRHHKEQLYKEAGVVEDVLTPEKEDEMLLNEEIELPETSQKKNKKERTPKPDPFYHSKQIADEHKKQQEEKAQEKKEKEKNLRSVLKQRRNTAHKMQKRTQRGQPLMKYQIPNLLEKITSRLEKE